MNIILTKFLAVTLMTLTAVVMLMFSPATALARKISISVNESITLASAKTESPSRSISITFARPLIQRLEDRLQESFDGTTTILKQPSEHLISPVELTIVSPINSSAEIGNNTNTQAPDGHLHPATSVVMPDPQANFGVATSHPSAQNVQSDDHGFPHGAVSLTFDDGYQSGYTKAAPILEQVNMNATFYVISKFINSPPYMTREQMLALETSGNEIGAHSRTHPHFLASDEEIVEDEINGSKQDLLEMGVRSVSTFAYPFGEYNNFSKNEIQTAGYLGVRTSDDGAVGTGEDPYALEAQTLVHDTSLEQVQGWIDNAIQDGQWQILVFHKVDERGDRYSTTPELLQQIVDYLVLKNVPVITVDQGIRLMN